MILISSRKEETMGRSGHDDTKIKFSKEHVGKDSGVPERDTYRQKPDDPPNRWEKIGHNPTPTEDVKIKKG